MLLHSREGSGEHRSVDVNAVSTSPIMVPALRSRASRSIWSGPWIQPPVKSMCTRRRSHGLS
jgi:hypothetical protein